MGEVYRARDTKLDRDVALKVLPEAFTQDPDRLARFEREAKVLASLNHPNIGHIYGLEEADGIRALVLELVEGPPATLAENTSMRPVEVKYLRRRDADLFAGTVTVAHSKNVSSHRVIPLNQAARKALWQMLERADNLGFTDADHYLWPACQWGRFDPTQPIRKWDTAWRALRDAVGPPGLRFHDLRHTIITELAEMGVPDHVMESITGHLSRRMLEHYSHIRLEAKRKALESLEGWRADREASEGRKGETVQ